MPSTVRGILVDEVDAVIGHDFVYSWLIKMKAKPTVAVDLALDAQIPLPDRLLG